MDNLPDLPNGPISAHTLRRHADAILAAANTMQPGEAKAWREDAEHIRDAANRLEAIERGSAHG